MFRKLLVCCAAILVLSSGAEAAEKIKLGILQFSSPSELLKETDIITDSFIKTLSGSGTITLLNRIRSNNAVSSESEAEAVSDFGRSEGCRYILLGSVKRDKDIIISVRAVDVETAKIPFTVSGTCSSPNAQSLRAESIKLGDKVRERLTGEYPAVSVVKGKDIRINRGSTSGVRKGDLYIVYREYGENIDADGSTSGRRRVDLAVVEVNGVQKDYSTANFLKDGGDARILPELDSKKAEAISRSEARRLISRKTFSMETIMQKHSDAGAHSDLGKSLNAGVQMSDLEEVKSLAENGHPAAQNNLGVYYMNRRDFRQALKWLNEAAEQGNISAYNNLGYIYDNGLGVPLNASKAFGWYLKAAEQGTASAQVNIGQMYQHGRGVGQDYARAFLWYAKAWQQEEDKDAKASAANNMAYMYDKGLGVKHDIRKAASLYREAARSGLLDAKTNLGIMICNALQNSGVTSIKKGSRDYALHQEAQKWLQDALEQAKREHNSEFIRTAQEGLDRLSGITIN